MNFHIQWLASRLMSSRYDAANKQHGRKDDVN